MINKYLNILLIYCCTILFSPFSYAESEVYNLNSEITVGCKVDQFEVRKGAKDEQGNIYFQLCPKNTSESFGAKCDAVFAVKCLDVSMSEAERGALSCSSDPDACSRMLLKEALKKKWNDVQ